MRRHDEGAGGARLRLGNARGVLASGVVVWCCRASLALASPPSPELSPACDPIGDPTCVTPEPQTAGEWYSRGIELGNAEDFAAAADAFLRSYELRPTPEALFNAALAQEHAGAPLDAIANYERFLAEPEHPAELVEPAERSIESLTRTIGVLKGVRYHAERRPTELYVNGERVELERFPLRVLPGQIEIEAVDEQGVHVRERYELLAGEALLVDLRALLPPPEPPAPKIVEPEGSSAEQLESARLHALTAKRLRTATWVGLGLTGATTFAAATVGGLALRERERYGEDNCVQYEGGVCPSEHVIGDVPGHRDRYSVLVISGTVLAGVSGAAALGTLIVGLVSLRHQRASRLTHEPSKRANVRLQPLASGLELRF